MHENESVYLPLGCAHRLANPGKIPVEIVEVQTGAYLEEDDIVRIEDDFGRAEPVKFGTSGLRGPGRRSDRRGLRRLRGGLPRAPVGTAERRFARS